ncbi:MAG: flagellar filament capping protein FliD, partial [Synergistaceae bacterium]|nr:flagellar filament capping protein FliD [Synergistaceae bacterium]
MTDGGTLASRVKIVDEDEKTYTYGKDFTIKNSKVSWLEKDTSSTTNAPSSYTVTYSKDVEVSETLSLTRSSDSTDAINATDFSAIEAKYREAYSLDDLPTITLTDGDGVLRTYLDPADRSLFTITDGTNTYNYGKDYVIRVNDTGDGWTVSWAISGDTNSDGNIDINDASKDVTAYMQEKGITTYGMQQAPASGDSINLSFTGSVTVTDSATVKSSDDDKSLATILENVTVSSSDYSTAITIKNGSTTYVYGKDYTIDSDGNIEWLTKATITEDPTSYTVRYKRTDYDSSTQSAEITALLTKEDTDLDKVAVILSDGTVCTQGTDYTINDDGSISWIIRNQPEEGKSYTLYYEAFSALEATADYKYEDDTTALSDFSGVELTYSEILKDAGVSKQKTSESDSEYQERIDTALAELFTLSDSSNTYTYGTDYTIIDDGDDAPVIKWINTPVADATMTLKYTGKGEGGGEVLSMPDAIQRSASDTINVNSVLDQPLYSKFEGASVRITNGTESFEEGTDFTVTTDSAGYAVIEWNTDTTIPPLYTGNFDSATSITAADSDGNAITGFTISDDDGYASFSMDDGSVLDDGDYTVTVVKGGRTKIYDLISDGSSMSLVQRSKWDAQDVSSAGTYTITVSKDGQISTYTGTRPKNSYNFSISTASFDFTSGTNTITQGTKTFYEGVDFNIGEDDDGNPTVDWIPDSEGGYEWYYPTPMSSYTLNHTDSDGNTVSFTGIRTSTDTLSLQDYGMTVATGALSVQYGEDTNYYNLEVEPVYETDEDGEYILDADGDKIISSSSVTGNDVLKATHSFTIDKKAVWTGSITDDDSSNDENYSLDYTFNWRTPELTSRTLPGYGDELSIEYEYDANTFSLEDDGDGLIDALGLNLEDNITEAHNAIISLNGEEVQRDSNNIGEAYSNEISNLKGVTLQLKGLGSVSLDIYHDAEKAIEAITTFKDNYNDLMTWMNTRMTESQLDENTAATVDSDDFRMRWGLLHGNALLRQTKSAMRNLTAKNFTYSFTQNTSSEEIYGTLANNGLRNDSTLRMRIGSTYMDLTLSPSHTLQDVVDMINDSTNVQMYNNFYDEDGKLREQPLIKASVSDDKIVIA